MVQSIEENKLLLSEGFSRNIKVVLQVVNFLLLQFSITVIQCDSLPGGYESDSAVLYMEASLYCTAVFTSEISHQSVLTVSMKNKTGYAYSYQDSCVELPHSSPPSDASWTIQLKCKTNNI